MPKYKVIVSMEPYETIVDAEDEDEANFLALDEFECCMNFDYQTELIREEEEDDTIIIHSGQEKLDIN